MAMRRTLFVFPRELLPAGQVGAADRVAAQERGRLVRDVEKAGLHADGAAWLEEAEAQVVRALAGGRLATSSQLRDELPALQGAIRYGEGKSWGGDVPIGPRVLTAASADGRIVRAANDGGWHVSRPLWGAMDDWLGGPLERPGTAAGTAELVAAWLRAFGPGTTTDLKWWLGGTVAAVKRALADLQAVEVALDGGATGWVLPDDLAPTEAPEASAALLPCLDPTTMGWFERDWYLGPHREQLFDRNGNAGPTAWWEGRIVGGWRQDDEGRVELQLLEPVPRAARQGARHRGPPPRGLARGRRVVPRFRRRCPKLPDRPTDRAPPDDHPAARPTRGRVPPHRARRRPHRRDGRRRAAGSARCDRGGCRAARRGAHPPDARDAAPPVDGRRAAAAPAARLVLPLGRHPRRVPQRRLRPRPADFSAVPRVLRTATKCSLILLSVSPPDEDGWCSLGTNAEYVAPLLRDHPCFVEVNHAMPRTAGPVRVNLRDAAGWYEVDRPLPTVEHRPPDPRDHAIAALIAERIPHGATLQLGIGNLPEALCDALHAHRDLGLHSELLSDGAMRLIESGVVTGIHKRPAARHRRRHVRDGEPALLRLARR